MFLKLPGPEKYFFKSVFNYPETTDKSVWLLLIPHELSGIFSIIYQRRLDPRLNQEMQTLIVVCFLRLVFIDR